jgi:hypothetical protein
MRVITIEEYFDLGVDKVIAEARRVVGAGPTYVSFDVDGLDPAYAPGTGTPEIGGCTPHEAQRMLRGLRGLDLVGGRGRGLAALRPERQHRAGRGHHDVGDALPAGRSGGQTQGPGRIAARRRPAPAWHGRHAALAVQISDVCVMVHVP